MPMGTATAMPTGMAMAMPTGTATAKANSHPSSATHFAPANSEYNTFNTLTASLKPPVTSNRFILSKHSS
jgi:hypothetical protein